MRFRIAAFAVAGVSLCSCSQPSPPAAAPTASAPAAASEPAAFRTLFDGTSFAGWTMAGDANWTLVDGSAQADSGTGFLVSDMPYADFDLEAEVWVTPDANSGVFIRCSSSTEITATTCYEVNIYDQRPDPSYRTGAIVDVAKPSVTIDAGGQWNTLEIAAHGAHLVVKLSGHTTVDAESDRHAAGPIGLQRSAGRVLFRGVKIRTQ